MFKIVDVIFVIVFVFLRFFEIDYVFRLFGVRYYVMIEKIFIKVRYIYSFGLFDN